MPQTGDIYRQARLQLIETIRKKGGAAENVLQAMAELPREYFVNQAFVNRAYEDTALPIDHNQTISQPYTVALMTTMLELKKNDKVLEIGTGSGYQACLLFMLGMRVFTIERIKELHEQTNRFFRENKMNIRTKLGDGTLGWKEYAPYDAIIVTAAAPDIPEPLLNQLAVGGRLVVPVGNQDSQVMYRITHTQDNKFKKEYKDKFKFVPLIGKEGWQE